MPLKGLILDLDNTIYPVSSVGEDMFRSLFELIFSGNDYAGTPEAVKTAIMRRPFSVVAREFSFSEKLYQAGYNLLLNMAYTKPMQPFPEYAIVRALPYTKFLVTTGFVKLQQSKIDRLGIADDFEKIFIVDPATSTETKKDIFIRILNDYGFSNTEVVVIGDDVHSEIKAGNELGIKTIIYDFANEYERQSEQLSIRSFSEIPALL